MGEAGTVMVPMRVEWVPSWLSWVSATTACLRALGVECDAVDVAGVSGYAFMMSVHKELCPSGPTVFDWGMLGEGVALLGRSTLQFMSLDCHGGDRASDATRGHCRAVYDLVAREVAEGRPCVIWGAYVPEFAAAIGVGDGCFHVKSFRERTGQPQPPIPCEQLEAPGGPYALAFPTPTTPRRPGEGDAHAVSHAARLLYTRRMGRDYGFGLTAYDTWIAALEADAADPFGNAYNAQCYAEGRRLAHEFLKRAAARNAGVAEPLGQAVGAYAEARQAMEELARVFSFPPGNEVRDSTNRAKAADLLRRAQAAEARAAEALTEAVANWP
jgi:hypothetical protein